MELAPRAVSFGAHVLAVAWIYQAHLAPPPPLGQVHDVELVAPLYIPPSPPPPPDPKPRQPPPPINRARVQPRAAATPPESAQTEALPAPPAPPAPEGAPIGETIAREAYVRNAKPLHRPDPKYPRRAERTGREGFVTLRFTILETGAVTDVEVVDADPRGYFEQASTEAVSQWRYAPCEWNGVKVPISGVMTRLRFELLGD